MINPLEVFVGRLTTEQTQELIQIAWDNLTREGRAEFLEAIKGQLPDYGYEEC